MKQKEKKMRENVNDTEKYVSVESKSEHQAYCKHMKLVGIYTQ